VYEEERKYEIYIWNKYIYYEMWREREICEEEDNEWEEGQRRKKVSKKNINIIYNIWRKEKRRRHVWRENMKISWKAEEERKKKGKWEKYPQISKIYIKKEREYEIYHMKIYKHNIYMKEKRMEESLCVSQEKREGRKYNDKEIYLISMWREALERREEDWRERPLNISLWRERSNEREKRKRKWREGMKREWNVYVMWNNNHEICHPLNMKYKE